MTLGWRRLRHYLRRAKRASLEVFVLAGPASRLSNPDVSTPPYRVAEGYDAAEAMFV